MTRDELLMAVVEAAREYRDAQTITAMNIARDKMIAAISALDAHRPEEAGETVEVAVWMDVNDGEMVLCKRDGGYHGILSRNANYRYFGTTALPIRGTIDIVAPVEAKP